MNTVLDGKDFGESIMSTEDIIKYCLSKHKAYEDYPFGNIPICYKLNGKIFAQIYPN